MRDLILCVHFNDENIYEFFLKNEVMDFSSKQNQFFSKVHNILKINWFMLEFCTHVLLNDF
jgi:hypothetical protein